MTIHAQVSLRPSTSRLVALAGLIGLSLACQVVSEDDLAARVDADGDGHPAINFGGDDCDDALAEAFPGAVEVPYDGIDQNCDPGDDDDSDRDGYVSAAFGGDDCDDADSTIYPGANEVWYDGVDQDCDGGADDDQDGDGFPAVAAGGTDCDDEDAAIHPDAEEDWYDGVDQDCDGADDYDQDGDGDPSWSWGGDDCEDEDPTVNGAAEEVCDGVDNDCDGVIDGPGATGAATFWRDVDTDGHGDAADPTSACEAPLGYADLDDDCDDGDASTYPGAPEQCDGADHDCDGVATCDVAIDDDTTIRGNTGDLAGSSLAFVGDVTGDGVEDVFLGIPAGESSTGIGSGTTTLVRGTSTGTVSAFSGLRVDGTSAGALTGASIDAAGDVDGDGALDLVIGSPAEFGGAGSVGVVFGPITSNTNVNLAGARVRGGAAAGFGTRVHGAGDLTGDGLADVYVSSPGALDVLDNPTGVVYLLAGPVGDVGSLLNVAGLAATELQAPAAGTLTDAVVTTGDVDGDGDADTLVSSPHTGDGGAVYVIYSPVPTGVFTFVDDADVTITALATGDAFGFGLATGDVTGDGTVDVLVGAPYNDDAESDAGLVLVYAAPFAASVPGASATATVAGAAPNDLFGAALAWAGDVDGDSASDLLIGAPGATSGGKDAGAAYIAYGPLAGTIGASGVGARMVGVDGYAGSTVAAGRDVDGDGIVDLAIGAPLADAPSADAGNVYLLSGATLR